MTFLNPLALFALAAAAIPLIIHLFNFRRPRRVEFSSLVFLRELERSTMQRVRIQQWLLLFLRTMAIACLVLAFSRPTLTGRVAGVVGDAGSGPLAIVIDNSLSMETLERTGERFRTARDAALRIIDQAGASDEIFIVTTSDGSLTQQPMRRAAATEAVAGLRLRPYTRPLEQVIGEAEARLKSTELGTGELFVLSDFQRTTLQTASERSEDTTSPITLVPVGERMPSNVAVTGVNVVSRIVDVGQPVRLEAIIHNFSASDRDELIVAAYLGEERIAQAAASVAAESSVRVPLVLTPRERGWLEGRISIDDEGIAADDIRFFSLFVPERRRLLIVRGSERMAQHLILALSPEVSDGRVMFEREIIPASALSSQALGEFDAVVLAGLSSFSSGEVSLLANYVQDGGGLMLYPGANAEAESYNLLLERLGGGRFGSMTGAPGASSAIASIGNADLEHPLFEGVFESGGQLEQADVFAALPYEARGASEQTVISLTNGWPLLQEIRSGVGTSLLFASALDPLWNELSVRGLFVPLIYRSLFYLSASEADVGEGISLSEEATVRLVDRAGRGSIIVVTPRGEEIAPDQRRVFGTRRVAISGPQMGEVGFARLIDADTREVLHITAVNLDPAESDPTLYSGLQAADLIEEGFGTDVRTVDVSDGLNEFSHALRESRRGVEIWNVFLLLALGFLVAEMLVAKRWRPEIAPA